MFKTCMLAIIFSALGLSALVVEAGAGAAAGVDAFNAARASESANVRTRIAANALSRLETSWARPLTWHAGAAEIASGLYALRADAAGASSDRNAGADYARSAALAARAVQLSPVLPSAWLRLAVLGARGHANSVCAPVDCLEQSWRVVPILDAETECLRLQTAYRLGANQTARAHLGAYLRTPASLRAKAQCLAPVMTSTQLFSALLSARTSASGPPR